MDRGMAIWTFLRLEFAKPAGFGPARSALLQSIIKYGSIAAAAGAVGTDYRAARETVRSINREFGDVIVLKRGRNGGAHLTPKGEKLLQRYLEIERKFYQVFAEDLRYLEKIVGDDHNLPARIQRYALVRESRRTKPADERQKPAAKGKRSNAKTAASPPGARKTHEAQARAGNGR
jgi:molybdate transport repressor ModE-like protein